MTKYEEFKTRMAEIADLRNATAVLSWDQEVYMPANGASARARQLATLAGISHEKATAADFIQLIDELSSTNSLSETERLNVWWTKRDIDKQTKLPKAFVQKMSLAVSQGFVAWQAAKKESDFKLFQKELESILALKREQAEIIGYENHPYDVMLDVYEPGLTIQEADGVLYELRDELLPLLDSIRSKQQVSDELLHGHFPEGDQWNFGIRILENIGFNFESGRQDKSTHPFTMNFSAQDVRITTRINEVNLAEMIWSTIHEAGHGIYEQGLPVEEYGLPAGSYLSLAIHESQSRLYENNLGRALPFWTFHYPILREYFPNLPEDGLDQFYRAMNQVKPSLIRTSADELTYHFHVIIRYEIEKQLFSNELEVADVPEAWNSLYEKYLGVRPDSDAVGALQDIHWSHGSFGYFPTYTMGSLYAAQFMQTAIDANPGLIAEFEQGRYDQLKSWLNKEIHSHGRTLQAQELCEKVSGRKLDVSAFMSYAKDKYAYIYGLD